MTSELSAAVIDDPLVVAPETTVMRAIALMSGWRSSCPVPGGEAASPEGDGLRASCVVVVDEARRVQGIMTERDVVFLSTQNLPLPQTTIAQVMTHPVVTVRNRELGDLFGVIGLLQKHRIRHLPLVDEQDRLVGLVTHDSLRRVTRPIDLLRLRSVGEVMTQETIWTLPTAPIFEIAQLMVHHRISSVVIGVGEATSPQCQPLGMLTERDLVQCQALGLSLQTTTAQQVMSTPLFTIGPEASLWTVQQRMEAHQIRRLVVTDGRDRLLGLVTQSRVLQALNPIEIYNLTAILEHRVQTLEAEKIALLENRALALEAEIHRRTAELQQTHHQLRLELGERRQAEQALRDNEQHLTSLMQGLPVGVFRTDRRGEYLYVNERWCHITGLSPQQTAQWFEPIHPEDGDRVWDRWQRTLGDPQRDQLEFRYCPPDRPIVWVNCQWVPETNDRGEVIGYLGSLTDISDRKHNESQLAASEAQFQNLAATIPGLLFIAQTPSQGWPFRFTYINTMASSLLELEPAAILADSQCVLRLFHPQDRFGYGRAFLRSQKQGTSFCHEWRIITPSGQTKWLQVTIHPETLPDRQIRWFGVVLDVSDRKRASLVLADLNADLEARVVQRTQELQEREARYYALMEEASDAIVLANAQGQIIEVNRQAESLFGYSREQFTQMHQSQLHPPEMFEEVLQAFNHTTHGLRKAMSNTLILRQDGEKIPVDITGTVIPIGEGVIVQGIFRDIRDRQKAEADRQALSERLTLALRSGGIGCWEWDIPQNVLVWDERMFELYGVDPCYAPDQLPAAIWEERIHPEDRIATETLLHQAVQGEKTYNTEFRIIHDDGSIHHIRAHGILTRDAQGQPQKMIGVNFDISDRKRSESNLRESEHRFRRVFDSNVVGMLFARLSGPILEVNDRFLQMLGYTREDFQRSTIDWMELTPEEYREQDRLGIAYLKANGTAPPAEKAYYHKKGHRVHVLLGVASLYPDVPDDDTAVCFVVDISDRKRAENSLKESQKFLQTVLNTLPLSVFWKDRQSAYLGCNQKFAQLFNLPSPEAVRGKTDFALLTDAQEIQHSLASDRQVMNSGDPLLRLEESSTLPSGEKLWGETYKVPLRNWSGQIVGLVGVFQDITERKQIQQQLIERNEELARSNEQLARATRLKDEFLANMSHELRTPLNAILGMTESLLEEIFGPINEVQRKSLVTIEHSGTHLLALINDILDIAKIESGQIELKPNLVDASAICTTTIALIKPQALKKNLTLTVEVDPQLPSLWVDSRRIRQSLLNLLTNAVKFTPENGAIRLSVSLLRDDSPSSPEHNAYIRFAVTDTGIGIAPEHLPKLFRPFIQIDSALNRKYSGTGLGLALVKQLTELHGGRVGMTSTPGRGSCFTMDLPCTAEERPTEVTIAPGPDQGLRPESPVVTPQAPLLLVVDDNEANISTVALYLEAKGYRVITADDGAMGIAQATATEPDLIVMDIQMPGLDGLEAIQILRRDPRLVHIPIIALTALVMDGDRERCLQAGANAYLAKPIKLRELVACVEQLLHPRSPIPEF